MCICNLSFAAVYVFDRGVLENMMQEEQKRIQRELERFAEKLKHHGVSLMGKRFCR